MKNTKGKNAALNPRWMAIKALGEVLDEGKNLSDCTALKGEADARNLAQARHLAYGVLRWQVALAWLEAQLLSKPIKPKERDISRLLWLGMFQLWQDRTPDHAAINETTECARSLGKTWAVNMVNAVLRRFQREQVQWLEKLAKVPEHWAHPTWLQAAIKSDWPKCWQDVLEANNQSPPLWIRVNLQQATLEAVKAKLGEAGFTTQRNEFAAEALLVAPAAAVNELPGFSEGHFSVQDAAAQLAAVLLDVQPGMRVLDACAAPGGKTCHLLEQIPGLQLLALERYANRLHRVQENLDRLHVHCELLTADATDTSSWWDGKAFDRILLDAPCSATGVIRRHPEIRHLRPAEQVQEAVKLQQALLQQLWPTLAPGGMLLYATCSLLHDENANQIKNFLSTHGDAEEQLIEAEWGHSQAHGSQILPGEQDMDGFYYARLRKRT
ncbi:MAG: 16S rRNA (cytosine(967)-C(5))-methyltransferase RsmB [Xanthomonadales bacterium]|nr:16S rRNA (cytosine(967)-C(5))-methyltransferase RsmB [Xanthomonadales bacterium]